MSRIWTYGERLKDEVNAEGENFRKYVMELIVALGNPGPDYENTRHNIAWSLLSVIIKNACMSEPHESGMFSGNVCVGNLFGKEVRFLFPTTFMNNSGVAVKKALDCEPLSSLIVIHDEVDLPFGTIRIAEGRGAGGHNGVKSIISEIGSKDFVRIRIGVAKKNIFGIVKRPQGDKLGDFVLGELSKKEQEQLPELVKKVTRAIELMYTKDVKVAMTEINSK